MIHALLANASGPVFEIRLARSKWAHRVGDLYSASILAAKQMTRRRLDRLYNPDLIAVGMFKPVADLVDGSAIWVCGVHLLVSGIDEQRDLDTAFGGRWTRVERPSQLRVSPAGDLSEAIKRVFQTELEWRTDCNAVSKKQRRRFKTDRYGWLFAQKADERIIRYGCDRHFNKLDKKPRVLRPKAPPRKRPYPYWLEHYMFGGELRSGQLSDFTPGSRRADRQFRRRNPLMTEIYFENDPEPEKSRAGEEGQLISELMGRTKTQSRYR